MMDTQSKNKNSNSIKPLSSKQKQKNSLKHVPQTQKINFRIATLNIQTINQEKIVDVMEYMTTNNIDILGLAETNVNKSTLRILEHTVQDKFKLYFTTEEKKGTGIRFLVKKEFAIYVQQFQHFEGRIGFIDFYTKKKKIRIVQVYINVQDKEKPQVKRLYKQIEHWTNQCLDSFVKDIIIIGDFNTKWNEYELLDAPHWRHDIFNYFKKHFIKESTSVFCDDISDMYTHIPNNPNHAHNKIDYIWCNIDLMLSTMDSKPQDVQPVIKTDHRMITLDLFIDDIIINKNNTQKRQTPSKTIYCYDEMQRTDGEWNWDKFNKDISEYLDDPNIKLTTNKIRGINSQKQLSQLWNLFRKAIMHSAKRNIKQKKKKLKRNHHPLYDSDLKRDLNMLKGMLNTIRRAKLDFNDRSIENRQKIITHITTLHRRSNGIRSSTLSDFISITKRHNITISNHFLRDKTFQYKDILQNTIIVLESKYINATYEYKKNMMDTFIQERNQNYKTDKKKMIKSVLERPHTSLSINKVYKNDNNEDILYTEESEVKEQTNLHFQTIAGAINCEKDLSQHPEWQDQYQPKHDVQYTIYSDLMKYPTLDEWIDNVKSLPNNKASGPSGISYEMLKNLNEDNQSFLHAFICVCMDLNDIPDEWKKATIFPIPKLKPFFANLTNTRPITLLETPRKAFISLLNRRLSRILKNNNVLKGNQFAALPGNSTFEPIRMINEIIQDAKENNKELWLLSQDLGKAYDRVNIFMLEKAMERIKIPPNFIQIISSLFKNRQNQVITAYGLTDPYNVLIGIDQGEVISPLLWCIYYDPLLCEIEQRKLGYTLEAPKIALNKFYGEDTSEETEKLTISSSAYMDDTQWLAPSQNNLEKILEIADSFYKLNDIQVNKEKSELLVRYKQGRYRPKLKPHEPVTLRFGSDSIFIIPVSPRSSIRILGVYFDERNTFQSTIKRINDEINELRYKYARKRITDKHMIYIFNSVIIPRIEYWSQVKIYNVKNIGDNQDQAKITNILIQINDASVLEQILSDDGLLLSTNEIRDKFNIPTILALKWYRKVITALNTNNEILSSINRIYNTNYSNCPITTQQFSRESEADRIRKNYTSKPILLNTDNYPNYYIGTPKKNVDFDTDSFTLEHYKINSISNNNKLEISRCQGCNNTTSTYTPLRPRRNQVQESFCNIECNISNTSILYTGQSTTATRDKHRLIPVDLNSHLHQVNNLTSSISNLPTIRNTSPGSNNQLHTIDKNLLQHFETNSKLETLHIIQQHLKDEDTLSFYTDGSLINANTQAASMTAGFIRVSDTNLITHSFTTTIENWPSSLRAELFAILLSLIVSPHGCRVDINTDSQNSINIIQRIYNNPTFSIRDYFRLPNNNIVINNIVSIIKAKNLTLRFNKVKAHNNNYFNELIDQECKAAHYDSTPALIIKQHYFDNIKFIPQWGSIPIERKLRKFITDSSNIKNYLSFLHLPQNYKYKDIVDWDITLWILCNNGDKAETNFEQHRKMIFKYKLLSEQLAVLEKTKRQYYDRYQDSDCPLCAEEKETFTHIWLCPYQTEAFRQLYNNFKNTLIFGILNQTTDVSVQQLSDQFDLLLYTKNFHASSITFIDIIKGFVPTTLIEWLQKYTTATQRRDILIKAFDKLYEDSMELWKSRCEAVASIEHMCGITQYMKRSISYNTKYKEPFTSYYNINSFFDFSSLNIEYIEYINLLIRFNVAYIDLFAFDTP
ncbi:RNA-directed DNA polymerase from mobile element jockey-like [Rhizophagus clarus]|uniref:RNA-directed DNA polymerase from mobile element jockey-like n=1 Tax=Rhizophagus clarus TaxID=94130 RepID=A0A8H3R530_9GLOM|nr:RNA-directed DNA polymerase from mobile element jockey-like [Rhizophagus clarus]